MTAVFVGRIALALALCGAIGLEREARHKQSGLRTNTLVGLGAAVAMLVSKYGFDDVLSPGRVVLDPSRVAAQIVSGIGFIGAGIIFVRRDSVHGLTTAAVAWLTAMVGMACGAGLLVLAVAATAAHFIVVVGLEWVEGRLHHDTSFHVHVEWSPPTSMEQVVAAIGQHHLAITSLQLARSDAPEDSATRADLNVSGSTSAASLGAVLAEISGVSNVHIDSDRPD